MGIRKYGQTGQVTEVEDAGQEVIQRTAAAGWSPDDDQDLAQENAAADAPGE